MNKHLIIFDKPLNLGGRRHRVRLSIPQTRHTFKTATWLAPFEREELMRLHPDSGLDSMSLGLKVVRESVARSQYAYQIHVDGEPCGICGVLPPDDHGDAVIWYLPTHLVALRYRRVLLPLSRALIQFFAALQPNVRRYKNGLTRFAAPALRYLSRLAALRESDAPGYIVFEITVQGEKSCVNP